MRVFLVLLSLSLATACSGPAPDEVALRGADFVPEGNGRDYHVMPEDLRCLEDVPRVGRLKIDTMLGGQAEAERVAAEGGTFPVGTVLAGTPYEYMIKRGRGFSPETDDWEFLRVTPQPDGTSNIVDRGTTEVRGVLPLKTCVECHSQAEPQWDWVCSTGRGCDDLPLALAFEHTSRTDPRCRSGFAPDR